MASLLPSTLRSLLHSQYLNGVICARNVVCSRLAITTPELCGLFEYPPLSDASSEIRLVYVHASLAQTPDGDDVPWCTIKHCRLTDSPAYTALSYTWGDPKDTTTILVNGKRKDVTSSLASFLHQARTTMIDNGIESAPFWIDAICINQGDDEEKSQQIKIMKIIYSMAKRVIVWLGTASEDSNLAFQLLRDLAFCHERVASDYEKDSRFPASLLVKFPECRALQDTQRRGAERWLRIMSKDYDKNLRPVRNLASRSWWRRVWVQQEVGLAPIDRVSVACGDAMIPWIEVVIACTTLRILTDYVSKQERRKNHRTEKYNPWAVQQIRRTHLEMEGTCRNSRNQIWGKDDTLELDLAERLALNAFRIGGGMLASLLVDYVYSNLSVARDALEVQRYIQPDYSRPPEEVFIELTRYFLHKKGAATLAFVGIPSPKPVRIQVPSWIADWSSVMDRVPLSCGVNLWQTTVNHLYSASGKGQSFFYEVVGLTLCLKGLFVDIINDNGIMSELFPAYDPENPRPFGGVWLAAYDTFRTRVTSAVQSTLRDAWWRVPIADHDDESARATVSLRSQYDLLMKDVETGTRTFGYPKSEFELVLREVVPTRVPFLSSTGMLGLGPQSIQPGDKIFVILGCDTPFILRDADCGHYRIVGEAYVHGIMDGEFMESKPTIETLRII